MPFMRMTTIALGLAGFLGSYGYAEGLSECAETNGAFMTTDDGCTQRDTGLTWSFRAPGAHTHQAAQAFCATLPATVNGAPWTLPSVAEMRKLSKLGDSLGAIAFPMGDFFWTRNEQGASAAAAIPATGESNIFEKKDQFAAACVTRTYGCMKETSRFVSDGGGCHDVTRGIVWAAVPAQYMTYEYARDYCQNLVEGGRSDWMLPSLSDMNSIAIDTQAIGIIPGLHTNRQIWTSTVAAPGHETVRISSGIHYPLAWAELLVVCARRISLNN